MRNELVIFIYFVFAILLIIGATLLNTLSPELGLMVTWFASLGLVFNFIIDVARK